jgi:L-serine/L-threonine ammonia-lyase
MKIACCRGGSFVLVFLSLLLSPLTAFLLAPPARQQPAVFVYIHRDRKTTQCDSFRSDCSAQSMSSASTSTNGNAAGQLTALNQGLYIATPLVRSPVLSQLVGKTVYLKLDNLQPSGSFKDRGMAHLVVSPTLHAPAPAPAQSQQKRESGPTQPPQQQRQCCTKLVCSSGGNAGLALATVVQRRQQQQQQQLLSSSTETSTTAVVANRMQVEVVVPITTKQLVIDKLSHGLGASVTVHGQNWNAADELARQRVERGNRRSCSNSDDDTTFYYYYYVSPYDNPLLWTGHSTLVDEIVRDIGSVGTIVVSVGGGGLLCGVLEGLERHSLHSTTVIAAETTGASSFGQAWQQGGWQPGDPVVRLASIDSIATSLGALQVTTVALERAKKHQQQAGIVDSVVESAVCTDQEAVDACWRFAQDHRMLVEPACGAALAVAYSERLRNQVLANAKEPIVIQVCGGSGVSADLLTLWKKDFLTHRE